MKTCKVCDVEMDATLATQEFPHCNTWTCPECRLVELEILPGCLFWPVPINQAPEEKPGQ